MHSAEVEGRSKEPGRSPEGRLGTIADRINRRMPWPATVAVLDQGVVSVAGFATTVFLGRAVGQAELGVFSLGLAVLLLADEVQASLANTPYLILSPGRSPASRARLAGSALVHQGVLGVVSSIAAAGAFLSTFFVGLPAATRPALGALVIALPLYTLAQFVRRICFADLRFRSALWLDVLISVSQLLALVVLVATGALTGGLAIAIAGVARGVFAAVWIWRQRTSFHLDLRRFRTHTARSWRLGRWVVASSVLYMLTSQFYPWILTFSHSVEAAGIFAACLFTRNALSPVVRGAQNYIEPRVMHLFKEGSPRQNMGRVFRLSVLFAVVLSPIAIVLWTVGGELVAVIYGEEFQGHGDLVAVLAVSLVLSGATFPISRGLYALQRTDLEFYCTLLSALALASAGLYLVITYGPIGAGLSLLLTQSVGSLARVWLFRAATRP